MALETQHFAEFSKTLDKHHKPGWGVTFVYGFKIIIPCPNEYVVSVLAVSISTVALAEIGDRTQLLSLLLVSRYRKPVPIILAILAATVANHALAAWLGVVVADYITPEILKWVVAASFLAMAGWILIPDKIDDDETISNHGPFVASFIAFFIAEIGDKTQIATSILGANYASQLEWVVVGSTIGMLLANVPVVLIGKLSADKMPLALIRKVTALLFIGLAVGSVFY